MKTTSFLPDAGLKMHWWPVYFLCLFLQVSCMNEETVLPEAPTARLEISAKVTSTVSRNAVKGTSLPDGSQIGVMVVDDGDSDYQDKSYDNVCYTASRINGTQKWSTTTDVSLSGEAATLYAYHPWKEGLDIENIPVNLAATQEDWMYATPVKGLDNSNYQAQIQLNHALANMNISLVKGNFKGAGKVSKVKLESEGIASAATLNAKTGELTAIQHQGEVLEVTCDGTLGNEPLEMDILFIPTEEENTPIKVDVTIDNKDYTVTSGPVTSQAGTSVNFTLIHNSVELVLTGVSVTPWTDVSKNDDLELHKPKP